LHPKHWKEFTGADAPPLDLVFTLGNAASKEEFPAWPGTPVSSHWRYPDPKKAEGEVWERRLEYGKTLSAIERQMRALMQLSFDALDRVALDKRLSEIARD
jgi:protein-tyrosine-phosphatase